MNIRAVLKRRNWTQRQLAAEADVHFQEVHLYAGGKPASLRKAAAIARATGYESDLHDLMHPDDIQIIKAWAKRWSQKEGGK